MTRTGTRLLLVAAAFVLAFPWLPFASYSIVGTANLGAYYAMVAIWSTYEPSRAAAASKRSSSRAKSVASGR